MMKAFSNVGRWAAIRKVGGMGAVGINDSEPAQLYRNSKDAGRYMQIIGTGNWEGGEGEKMK